MPLLLVLVLVLMSTPSVVEAQRFAYQHYRQSNGLPAEQVRTAGKGNYGALWIGTDDGLFRFDGRQILPHRSFSNPMMGIQSLASREIDVLVFDKTVMRYLINQEQLSGRIQLLPLTFNKQYRSFLFPKGSQLFQDVNPVLVDRVQRASWEDVLKKYDLTED